MIARNRRGGDAKDAKQVGVFVEIGIGIEGFDQATGEDTDEGDLFDETGGIGGFDAGEVTFFEAAGVETVLEVVAVTGLTTTAAGGGCGHDGFLVGGMWGRGGFVPILSIPRPGPIYEGIH